MLIKLTAIAILVFSNGAEQKIEVEPQYYESAQLCLNNVPVQTKALTKRVQAVVSKRKIKASVDMLITCTSDRSMNASRRGKPSA